MIIRPDEGEATFLLCTAERSSADIRWTEMEGMRWNGMEEHRMEWREMDEGMEWIPSGRKAWRSPGWTDGRMNQ